MFVFSLPVISLFVCLRRLDSLYAYILSLSFHLSSFSYFFCFFKDGFFLGGEFGDAGLVTLSFMGATLLVIVGIYWSEMEMEMEMDSRNLFAGALPG